MRRAEPRISQQFTRRSLGALLLCALWCWASRPALANETDPHRVLLIEQGRDPFLERVGAELEELGLSLVRSDAKGPLERVAREAQAVVAIRVLPSRIGVEVWMADATSGRSLLRQIVVDENPAGPDRELIALQTAELVRTSLFGEKSAREPIAQAPSTPQLTAQQPSEPVSVPQPETSPAATAHETSVQLLGGALYSPGGASPSVELGLSLQHFLTERWGVGLDLGMPVHTGAITGIEGSTKLGAYFASALLLARFQNGPSPFFATAGVGAGALLITYDGETRAPLHSTSGSRVTGAAYLRGDAGVEVAPWLRLGLRLLAGASLARTSVMFAGNAAGSFGPAFFAGFVFAELALF